MECPIKKECGCISLCHHMDQAEYCAVVRDRKQIEDIDHKVVIGPHTGETGIVS